MLSRRVLPRLTAMRPPSSNRGKRLLFKHWRHRRHQWQLGFAPLAWLLWLLSLAPCVVLAAVDFPSASELDAHLRRHQHTLLLVGLEKGCPKCTLLLEELELVQVRSDLGRAAPGRSDAGGRGAAASAAADSPVVAERFLSLTTVDVKQHKANLFDFEVTEVPTLLWMSRAGGVGIGAAAAAAVVGPSHRGVLRRQRLQRRGLPEPQPFRGYELTAEGMVAFINARLGKDKVFVFDPLAIRDGQAGGGSERPGGPGRGGKGGGGRRDGGGGGGAAAAGGGGGRGGLSAGQHAASASPEPSAVVARKAVGARERRFPGTVLDARTFFMTVLNPDVFVLVLFCNSWHRECKQVRDTCVVATRLRFEVAVGEEKTLELVPEGSCVAE
jgi:hypothetical protein